MADEEEKPEEEAAPAQAEAPPPVQAPDPFAVLVSRLDQIEARLMALERIAHSEHHIDAEGVQQIAAAAVAQVNEQIRRHLGLGGEPARG